jgi:hypothetical protein
VRDIEAVLAAEGEQEVVAVMPATVFVSNPSRRPTP